jgi:HEAT repeat protein
LGKIDPEWPRNKAALEMIPYLVKEGLADSRWIVRSSAAEALGDFGPAAAKEAPRLVKASNIDSSTEVRSAAKKALEKINR